MTDNINIESDEVVYKRTDLKREKETKNRKLQWFLYNILIPGEDIHWPRFSVFQRWYSDCVLISKHWGYWFLEKINIDLHFSLATVLEIMQSVEISQLIRNVS